jgi:hypothetical protein
MVRAAQAWSICGNRRKIKYSRPPNIPLRFNINFFFHLQEIKKIHAKLRRRTSGCLRVGGNVRL